MTQRETRFEQVPLEIVLEIVKKQEAQETLAPNSPKPSRKAGEALTVKRSEEKA
jgi:hypothetical protein